MDYPKMTTRLRAIEEDAMKLPAEERAELVERLVERLVESLDRAELSSEWRDEVVHRSSEYDAGRVKPVPLDEALARLGERVRRTRP
ncbi:MAG: addiction module protein [Burkholderiaceae bacterium]|nr:addiction module protein [Burkholderiaceae bacterium]